jgi:hypothetical protein
MVSASKAARTLLPLTYFAALAIVATAPLDGGRTWPLGHDGLLCHYRLGHFREAMAQGILYPRWLPNAFGGYGYPTFVFYPPGFFYLALPAALVFKKLTTAVYFTLTGLFFIGGWGAYWIGRQLADRAMGVFCAAMFVITPYAYVELYVRNALAEFSAMMLTPWPLGCLLWLSRAERSNRVNLVLRSSAMTGLAVSLAAVIVCHPATALFLTLALIWASLRVACDKTTNVTEALPARRGIARIRWRFLSGSIAAMMLGMALAIPYWVPLFELKEHVEHAPAVEGYFTPSDHVVHVEQFFSPAWGYGPSTAGNNEDMPFSLGLPHFLLAIIGIVASWRRPFVQATGAAYLFLLMLMTAIAAPIWNTLPILDYVQFPWRILSVTGTLQVACIAGGHGIYSRLNSWKAPALIAFLLIAVAWSYEQFVPSPKRINDADGRIAQTERSRLESFQTYAGRDEFTPKSAKQLRVLIPPRKNRPLVTVADRSRDVTAAHGATEYSMDYTIGAGPPTILTINQVYFPGWEVMINGESVASKTLVRSVAPDGRIRVPLNNEAPCRVVAHYAGPPGGLGRALAIGVSMMAFIAVAVASRTGIDDLPNS